MEKDSHVTIVLDRMRVNLRIGLHAHEEKAPQAVEVSVKLHLPLGDYLTDPSADTIVDYSDLYMAVKAWEDRPHTQLIESYIKELLPLCFNDDRVIAADIRITKPDIFPEADNVGVEAFVRRGDDS